MREKARLRLVRFCGVKWIKVSYSIEKRSPKQSAREQSPIAKKIWLPIHPRSFGCQLTVRPPARLLSAPQGNQCQMLHFLAAVGACNLIVHIHVVVN